MANWINDIVQMITPLTDQPIVVIDPQKFLSIGEIQDQLDFLGFRLIFAEPGIPARMVFEIECRGKSQVILIVQNKWNPLPDIRSNAFVLELDPKRFFRNFDSKAIAGLSFNALNTIASRNIYKELSFDETIRFLLENLYNIDLQAWNANKSKERMLDMLISVFKHPDAPNMAIRNYLQELATPFFGSTKAKELCDKKSLLEYLNNLGADVDVSEPMLEKNLADLKVKGLIGNVDVKKKARIDILLDYIDEKTKFIENQYKEWFDLAPILGELGDLVFEQQDAEIEKRYTESLESINNRFQIFRENEYEKQFSYSGIRTPITIDKVLDFIAASTNIKKIALIVIDGMNLWQWHMVKTELQKVVEDVKDRASFSWLPSITAWARQSVFSGKRPNLEEDNKKEKQYFIDYWKKNRILNDYQIDFQKINVAEQPVIPNSDIKVAGFVYNALDSMMHGTILGYRQLWQSTQLWIKESGICDFVKKLKDSGFDIYITTDHGNIDAHLTLGMNASEKQVSISRSKRFTRFDTEEQADKFIAEHPNQGLAKREKSVYFTNSNGFGKTGDTEITHGGSHIMELMIPVGIVK